MRCLASVARVLPVLVPLLMCSGRASAQCPSWESGFGANGLNGPVSAMTVFDDGTGLALYVGGSFTMAGGIPANGIATWNGSTWSALGSGLVGDVMSLAVYDDGSGPALFAGWYDQATGLGDVDKWTGSTWLQLGSGAYLGASALAVYDPGTGPALVACGSCFASRWDGASWTDLGLNLCWSGIAWETLDALSVFDDGTGPALYLGGFRVQFPYVSSSMLYRLDGSGSTFVGPIPGLEIRALKTFDDGAGPVLYVGGDLPGGVMRLDGSGLGSGLGGGVVNALTVFDDGSGLALYAAGTFTTASHTPVGGLAMWDGSTWSALGSGVGGGASTVHALTGYFDGSGVALYAGGDFTTAGGLGSNNLAAWSGCSGSGAGTSFCFGDASGAACPCSNSGGSGHGCQNSATTGGALLTGAGAAALASDTLQLTSSGELPSTLSIFLQGNADLPNAAPFGDGLRCVGGALKRMYAKNASGGVVAAPTGSDPAVSARSAALGDSIQAGQARSYQVYYRDPDPNFCAGPAGSTFNVSQALRILWAP